MCAYILNVCSLLCSDMAGVFTCPPAALDSGVGLLCRLFEMWGEVQAGILALTEWLLGEDEHSQDAAVNEASSLVSVVHSTLILHDFHLFVIVT